MKKIHGSTLLFCTLLVVISSAILKAQPISPIQNENLPQFLLEMDSFYNGLVRIPLSNIDSFLSPLLSQTTNECDAPDSLSVENLSSTAFTLAWQPVPAAVGYRVGYLNLENGNNGFVTVNAAAVKHTFDPMPNGFYLGFVQADCGNGNFSPMRIIIIDKVVLLDVEDTFDCCKEGETKVIRLGINNYLTGYQKFKINFKLGETIEYAISFELLPDDGVTNMSSYRVNTSCGPGSWKFEGNILYPVNAIVPGSLMFGTSENLELMVTFNEGLNLNYVIELVVCEDTRPRSKEVILSNKDDHAFLAIPNPFTDQLVISPFCPAAIADITIFDFAGRQVLQSEETNAVFDTSLLPPGIYYLKINDGKSEKTQKIVKI